MADKKALKGLKAVTLFPVTKNTETEYAVGEKIDLIGAQALSKSDEKEEYEIPADDDIYDTGSDYKYTTLELTVTELTPKIEAQITGGAYTEESGIYAAKSVDVAPEFALAYAALMSNGGYRLFRHPVVKLVDVKVEHSTKGKSNEVASYTLTLRSMARKKDSVYREQKDVAQGDALTWIQSIT